MRLAILSCGALVVQAKEQSWLFGAPTGVKGALDNAGLDVPPIVFTTAMRAPGLAGLGSPFNRFKEQRLNVDGLSAIPIKHKHGTDYSIECDGVKLLFSERGDVAVQDTDGYHLAIIKNKHRADTMGQNVITWPWPDAEWVAVDGAMMAVEPPIVIATKVWSSMDDIPDNLKSMKLSLEQANFVARVAEAAGGDGEENWAVAIAQFKKSHRKDGDKWVKREKDMITQEQANYEPAGGDGIRVCGNCSYYCQNMTCHLVLGDIQPGGVCTLWDWALEHTNQPVNRPEPMPVMPANYEGDMGFTYMGETTTKEGVTTTLEGRIASDHLLAGDEPFSWSLPVQTDGKPDHDLMSIAAAALTEGYKGQRYGGPGIGLAMNKLLDMYDVEEIDAPTALVELKEVKAGKPRARMLDILTADLHTAYNTVSDRLFKLGYLSQEERLKIAASIGTGLNAVRDALSGEEFANREISHLDLDYEIKEIADNWISVYKTKDDTWRWTAISSVADWDRQNELFPPQAMDWALKFAQLTNFKGPFRYRHIPGLDGGECDTQVRVGDYLFESGFFHDTAIGKAMRQRLMESPGNWGVSLGLMYKQDDLVRGKYKKAIIFERSMTQSPANQYTVLKGANDVAKVLTEAELQQAASELGLELTEVKAMYETSLTAGLTPSMKEFETTLKDAMETAEKTNGGGAASAKKAKPGEEEDEYDEEGEKKKMKEALEGLEAAELTALKNMIEEIETASAPAPAAIPVATVELEGGGELSQVLQVMAEQQKFMAEQTKAMTSLVATVLGAAQPGGGNTAVVEQTLKDMVSNLPRRQANQVFASGNAGQLEQSTKALDDATVASQLEAITLQLKELTGARHGLYNAFTSRRLNTEKPGR